MPRLFPQGSVFLTPARCVFFFGRAFPAREETFPTMEPGL
jgi:hypothetical protein